MDLHPGETVVHVHPGPFQFLTPPQVGLLVKARLHLDKYADLFAQRHRLHQRLHDARLARHPVLHDLDVADRRVLRRPLEEEHHRLVLMVGVHQQVVPLADGGPVVIGLLQGGVGQGRLRRILKLGHPEVREAEEVEIVVVAPLGQNVVAVQLEGVLQVGAQAVRHGTVVHEATGRTHVPPVEAGFDLGQEVTGELVVDVEFGVPRQLDAKRILDLVTREHPRHRMPHDVVQHDQVVFPVGAR